MTNVKQLSDRELMKLGTLEAAKELQERADRVNAFRRLNLK